MLVLSKGTRIVLVDSGSDSESESRRKAYSAGRFLYLLWESESEPESAFTVRVP
jgi:hypothetical protein